MAVNDHNENDPLIGSVHRQTYNVPRPIKDTREHRQQQLAIYLILASTLFERFGFYTLLATLLTTRILPDQFQWRDRSTKTASYIFSGLSYFLPIIIAIITDGKLGRARTIVIGFILYSFGLILITITASGKTPLCDFKKDYHRNATGIGSEKCAPAMMSTLILTAVGAAAVKSNLAVFGAEQIQNEKTSSRYFDKYCVAGNIGNIIVIVFTPYIKDHVHLENYYIPYTIATVMLFIATILFLIGWKFYLRIEPKDTVATKCIPVFFSAIRSWYRFKRNKRAVEKSLNHDPISLNLINVSHSLTEAEASLGIHGIPSTLLDFAKISNSGKFIDRVVEEVKSLRGALVVFTLLIPFWLIYDQVETTFPTQGQQMNGTNLNYVVSYMSFGDSVTIIVAIGLLNLLVYRFIDASHSPVTIVTKFIIGMSFTLLSMLSAGSVEIVRQNKCTETMTNSGLSIYTQLPQYIFIGLAQVFGMIASYEFAYFAAPRSAQSLFMSLHFCSAGVSSFLGAAYTNFFPNPNVEIDFQCKKDHHWDWSFYMYFYILGGLQLIVLILFIICHKKYQIIKVNPQQLQRA